MISSHTSAALDRVFIAESQNLQKRRDVEAIIEGAIAEYVSNASYHENVANIYKGICQDLRQQALLNNDTKRIEMDRHRDELVKKHA